MSPCVGSPFWIVHSVLQIVITHLVITYRVVLTYCITFNFYEFHFSGSTKCIKIQKDFTTSFALFYLPYPTFWMSMPRIQLVMDALQLLVQVGFNLFLKFFIEMIFHLCQWSKIATVHLYTRQKKLTLQSINNYHL